jgi:hypothetical protein
MPRTDLQIRWSHYDPYPGRSSIVMIPLENQMKLTKIFMSILIVSRSKSVIVVSARPSQPTKGPPTRPVSCTLVNISDTSICATRTIHQRALQLRHANRTGVVDIDRREPLPELRVRTGRRAIAGPAVRGRVAVGRRAVRCV